MNDLHHNCELWAEPISLLAAGCLSTDEERDVRRHFEMCPDCRERFGQLTQLCGALTEAQLPVNVAENAIVERVMSAVASEESRRPLVRTQAEVIQPSPFPRSLNRWRWIMRSPVSRIAAAAIFVLAITGVAMWFQGGGRAAFAFADFAARILEAKTVKCKMTIEMKGPPARTITSEVMTLDGARMRQVTELPDKSKVVMIEDLSQGKSLTLVPASKTATVLTSTRNRKDKTPEYGGLFTIFRLFQLVEEKPGAVEHESLGEKEIDGRKVVGFRISSQPHDLILWGDPKTGLPVRVEMTMGIEGSQKVTFSDFVFNVDMDESLFSVEPPAGYTVRNEKADVSPNEEKDLIKMFREYANLTGAFPDSLDLIKTPTTFWMKGNSQLQWDELAPGMGKGKEKQKVRFEELLLKLTDEKPSSEQIRNIQKEIQKLTFEMLWEDIAPENLKANEELRHKFQELMLKSTEVKVNAEKERMIEDEIRKIGGDEMVKAMKAWHPPTQTSTADRDARGRKFMDAQQRVQRGLQFANGLPPGANCALRGQRRFVWRGRHADLLVSAKGLEELSSHLCRSFCP